MPQTKIGNVCVAPAVEVRDHEVVDREREAEQRARRGSPGAISGSVTLRNVVHSFAPRSIAASSRWRSKPIEARLHGDDDEADDEHDVRDEDRHEAELEERRRVQEERRAATAPSTISGVAIGRKMSRFVAPRPRKRWRTSASAISVPSAGRHDRRDQRRPRATDSIASRMPEHGVPVEPVVEREALPHVVEAARAGSLNEKRITTAIGSSR